MDTLSKQHVLCFMIRLWSGTRCKVFLHGCTWAFGGWVDSDKKSWCLEKERNLPYRKLAWKFGWHIPLTLDEIHVVFLQHKYIP